MTGRTARIRLAAIAAMLVLAAACGGTDATSTDGGGGGDDGTAPVVLRAATLRPGQPVPAPAGKPLLTLTGTVSAPNDGGALALDRRTLAQLRQVEVEVYEPWVKKQLRFRGVWLQDLLAVAGATSRASIRITALDDYAIELTAADLKAGGVLLATSDGDGADIPVDAGGPTRIVFVGGVRAGANADQWIWSLRSIDIR